jgi:cysteine desulfurase
MEMINFDHISANPILPEVQEVMVDTMKNNCGNASSQHSLGDSASQAIDAARESVARLVNCNDPKRIIFTSGGTESVNHAIKGMAFANIDKGKHIVTTNVEHKAVINSLRFLKKMGFNITSVPVDKKGRVDSKNIEKAIKDDTILVSVMHSNNEIGTIQPIEEIARITKEREVLFFCDAVDSVGVVPIDVEALGVDAMAFASNSFYGPTGVGGLYIKPGLKIIPLIDGGAQENNRRAGAENIIGIVGMGVAAELALKHMDERQNHLASIRKKMIHDLPSYIDDYIINGDPDSCLPNLVSISLKYIEGESVVLMLDDDNIAASTRSACASGSLRASHVLLSTGLEFADAQGTLVITFGIDNKEEDVDRFLKVLKNSVTTLREMSPLYQKKKAAPQ